MTSSDSASLSLAWDIPDPLNGQLAAYELRYIDEETSIANTRLLFAVTSFRIFGLRMGVVYRVELRASTAGLLGESLWGPYAVLRVRDGVELEVPTEAPPTTVQVTTTTTPVSMTTRAPVAMTTDGQVDTSTTTTITMVTTTTDEAGTTMAPPTTTQAEVATTRPPIVTTAAGAPPTVAPSDLVVLASAGQAFLVWRVREI